MTPELKKAYLLLIISLLPLGLFAETVRILGVGNSFTQNSTRYLPQVIQSNPDISAEIALAYIGGCPLDKHVRLAEAHEANPKAGAEYRYSIDGTTQKKGASLKEILLDGEWDYVTIQQVSTKSYKIETYYPYAEQLIDYIRQYAPDAEIRIHETWPHSIDSYRHHKWGVDPDEMYAKLHAAYAQISEEFDLEVIPVGTAFQRAKEQPLWDYQPTAIDVTALSYPADKDNLPDGSKSLHRVFYWKKNKNGEMEVGNDGFHAGKYGEYLGALVWYESFFGADARKVTYKPDGFTEAQAVSLREIAHETMRAVAEQE